jgi:protein-S-isoprenylcysteine O-methyltransferase Ste14
MEPLFGPIQLVALGLFLLLFLGRSLQLWLLHGVQPFALVRGKRGARAWLEALLLLDLPLFGLLVVAYAWPLPALQPPAWMDPVLLDVAWARWAGAGLLGLGLLLFAAALASFGLSWRVGIDDREPGALVTGGVFALSRNPIFVFMDLYTLGTFLLTGRLLFLLITLLAWGALHWQILQEERFLLGLHGEPYRRYLDRVPRYLGWPRRARS